MPESSIPLETQTPDKMTTKKETDPTRGFPHAAQLDALTEQLKAEVHQIDTWEPPEPIPEKLYKCLRVSNYLSTVSILLPVM